MSSKIAVVLSGCGVYDGSEIQEVVLVLLALHKRGARVQCFAPDVEQKHVVNHKSGTPANGMRNVLVESARIVRGDVLDLAEYDAAAFDALLLPGGFGAAKNLSTFATEGANFSVNEQVARAVQSTANAGKPIAAMCIAPIILAKLLKGVHITLGEEGDAAKAAIAMGASHTVTSHGEVVVDQEHKVLTTPAYMLDANIGQIETGAAALVKALLTMCG